MMEGHHNSDGWGISFACIVGYNTTIMFVVEDRTALSTREKVLIKKLDREYTNEIAEQVLLPLLDHTSPVSLRALDWAVVNWSKQHNRQRFTFKYYYWKKYLSR